MEENYIVLVKAYPHSSWTIASGSQALDHERAKDLKTVLTGGIWAQIAIAQIHEVWYHNPDVGEIHGD